MSVLRQLGVGVIIAIASVMLVLGGIYLSLAETLPPLATPTQIPPTLPLSFPTPTPTVTPTVFLPTQTATATNTETASPSPVVIVQQPTICIPPAGWRRVTASFGDSVYSLAQRYKTSAESLSAANCLSSFDLPAGFVVYVPPVPTVTVIPCGPPYGWVRAHIVQRGETLYRVALSYGVTYPQLQRANCMGNSTTIYAGQRLWVPNIPMRTPTPGVTYIPNFPTQTSLPTSTNIPPTDFPTDIPTDVPTEPPTATTAPTSIPTSIPTSVPTSMPTVADPPTASSPTQ